MANIIRLRPILSEAIEACWNHTGRCDVYQVIAYARQHHPAVFRQQARALIDQAAYRQATNLLKRATMRTQAQLYGTSVQLDLPWAMLPGESPPLAIAVDRHDGTPVQYVKFEYATWSDIEAGLEQREINIQRAIAKRDDYVLKMDALRQVMQFDPARTVGEACEILRKEQPSC